jgi:probable HAF family extracellular repeat protein
MSKKPFRLHHLICALTVGAFASASPAHASQWQLQNLATLPVEDSIATAANTKGQVVGQLEDKNGYHRAVFFDQGQLIEMKGLGGRESYNAGINESGMATGSAQLPDGRWHAFAYTRAKGMQDVGPVWARNSQAAAINGAGQIVGFADSSDGWWHAFVRNTDGETVDLGTLGGKVSYASAINASGQIAGVSRIESGFQHAFIYKPGSGMQDLGTLGGRQSMATGINDAGFVVGTSETADRKWHAFMWDGKTMHDIGQSMIYGSSFATSINNKNQVVGNLVEGYYDRKTFIYESGAITIRHRQSGLQLTNMINDASVVVGAKVLADRHHAYLLNPDHSSMIKKVVEPDWRKGTLLAALLLLTAVALYRNRHWLRFGKD